MFVKDRGNEFVRGESFPARRSGIHRLALHERCVIVGKARHAASLKSTCAPNTCSSAW